jgi:hypothetical protein
MSHKFRKPKPISEARRAAARANGAKSHGPVTPEGKAKSALNAVTHGLTASAIVLTTESKEKYELLLASYLERCDPDGPIEIDLVEEIVAAKWQQRRVATMITALMDVTMDRMEKEIRDEFENVDNGVRTVLAFEKEAKQSTTLALLNRYAARHAREYHRALRQLREIQSERRDAVGQAPGLRRALSPPSLGTSHDPLATEVTPAAIDPPPSPNEKSQNEPKPDLTPERSTISEPETPPPDLANETKTDDCSSETGHRPLATGHWPELATSHESLATIPNTPPPSGILVYGHNQR